MNVLLPLLLAAGLASPALAQLSPKDKSFDIPHAAECGLITRYAGNRIPPGCLQESLNILYDEDNSMLRRTGYAKYNGTPCTDSKSVRGLWQFNATNGTEYLVIFSSQSFFQTTGAGDCTAISGAWSYADDAEFNCVQSIGRLWCANGTDAPFSWDGTSTAPISGMPTGSLIGAFRNRIVVADVAGALTRIRLSGELDGTDWTVQIPGRSTTPANIDISGTHDGQRVTCLLGEYQNAFFIGRENDLWALYGNDRRDFTLRKISSEVGCIEPKSVQEKNNALYWMSKRGLEKMSGTTIESVSELIKPTIREITDSVENTRLKQWTTQADWDLGNLIVSGSSSAVSSTISPGNIVASTWAVTDTSESDFSSGTKAGIWDEGSDGAISLEVRRFHDDFLDDEYASTPTWTVTNGAFVISDHRLTTSGGSGTNVATSSGLYVSSGIWTFSHYFSCSVSGCSYCSNAAGNNCLDYTFMQNAGEDRYRFLVQYAGPGYTTFALVKTSLGTDTYLSLNTTTYPYTKGNQYDFQITRSTDGTGMLIAELEGVVISSGADVSITSSSLVKVQMWDESGYWNAITGIDIYNRCSKGTFTSRIFNTGLSTPTGGPFDVDFSSSHGENEVAFYTRSATSPHNVSWTQWNATSDTLRVGATQQYWQWKGEFSTSVTTKTPTVSSVGLLAGTTAYYITSCAEIGASTISWGRFRVNSVLNDGALTFYISTGATCGAAIASTATWNTQIANSAVAVVTAPYAAAKVYFSIDSGSQTPTVNDMTLEWAKSGSRPPVASAVYEDRYYLFYTTCTDDDAHNDRVLVLDRSDKWSLYEGINAYSAVVYERKLYTGDSYDSGSIFTHDVGNDDAGSTYTYRYRTADLDMGDPTSRKLFKTLYLMAHSEADVSQDISLTVRYYLDGSTTAFSLGTVNLDEAAEPGYIVAKVPFPNAQRVDGHWISLEFEYIGKQGPVKVYGTKVIYEAIEPD